MRPLLRVLASAALAAGAAPAAAHDTWFAPDAAGGWTLATGNAFPVGETGVATRFVAASGCDDGAPLDAAGDADAAFAATLPAGAASCWARLQPFEVELAPALVERYLAEVRPPPDVAALARERAARGLPWRERYVKHARVAPDLDRAAGPPAMALDVVVESARPLVVRVWRDGAPFPGFAMEWRHERARVGLWTATDAEGRIAFAPPLAGRWLLRGVELRPEPDGGWSSRFLSFAFEAQKGSSFRSNARSTNQAAATSAIATEPPMQTKPR